MPPETPSHNVPDASPTLAARPSRGEALSPIQLFTSASRRKKPYLLLHLNRSGTYSLAQLKENIGRGRRWQLECRTFAERYDQPQLRALCSQANIVTWGHLRLVLWLPPRKRDMWLARCYRNRWAVSRLYRELKWNGVMNGPGGSRGGRPLGGSAQPALRLWCLLRLTEDWTSLAQEILDRHKDKTLPQLEICNATFWRQLGEAAKSGLRFGKKCDALRLELIRAIERIEE